MLMTAKEKIEFCGCVFVILFALFMSQSQGCADTRCPDGTSAKTLGFCQVPGGAGSNSVAPVIAGTRSVRFELEIAGALGGAGGNGGSDDQDGMQKVVDDGSGGMGGNGVGGRSADSVGSSGATGRAGSGGRRSDGEDSVVGGNGSAGSAGMAGAEATCGNGKRDPGELCDSDCPVSCDDNNPCTMDMQHGSVATCDFFCGYRQVEEGTVCGNNAYCSKDGQCMHNCQPGQPKCAGQPGTGSCVAASSFVMCDGGSNICVATWIPEGSTCGPGLTCDTDHNCK